MAYHSRNGREFVGLRASRTGRQQIVYDAITGERIVVTIRSTAISSNVIDDVLREGIRSRKVLTGVLKGLDARNIAFEIPG